MPGKPFFFAPIFWGAICLVSFPCRSALPQGTLSGLEAPSGQNAASSQDAPSDREDASGQEDTQPMVLRLDTREAAIEVVARDRHNLPIANLTANEFQVYEVPRHGGKIARRVLFLRIIDPERKDREEESDGGIHISSGAVCALDATIHYQLVIQASSEPGYHTVLVKTTRSHTDLTFRRQYYVGLTREAATPKELKKLVNPGALKEAACYHAATPPTLKLTAKVLGAAGGNFTHYAAVIQPESLRDIGVDDIEPRVQLDFGMCIFNADGDAVGYLHSTVDHRINAGDKARMRERGFVSLLRIPGAEAPAMVRLAVQDRNTGNLGIVDVSRPLSIAAQAGQAKKKGHLIGDIRAFGSVAPSENSFCGDVYELANGTSSLSSLQSLDPVGSLYTSALDVPDQDITQMGGIPGITHSSVWFGIDYYGKFYVTKPGRYAFGLVSDDGSRLEIDDQLLINLDGVHSATLQTATTTLSVGWHSIHVPYFQGPPTQLALTLGIQPPGESMRPFNLNEFVPPAAKPLGR